MYYYGSLFLIYSYDGCILKWVYSKITKQINQEKKHD